MQLARGQSAALRLRHTRSTGSTVWQEPEDQAYKPSASVLASASHTWVKAKNTLFCYATKTYKSPGASLPLATPQSPSAHCTCAQVHQEPFRQL